MDNELKQNILKEYAGKESVVLRTCTNGAVIIGDYIDTDNMLWYVIVKDGKTDLVSASRYPVIFELRKGSSVIDPENMI